MVGSREKMILDDDDAGSRHLLFKDTNENHSSYEYTPEGIFFQ